MTLREYCKIVKGEVEVWDKDVDVYPPYYNYDGENCFEDNEENHYLHLMENWFLSLPVGDSRQAVCSVECFREIEKNWDRILKGMQDQGDYTRFLNRYSDHHDEDMIIDYVEDVFNTMSQGFYGMAEDFCHFMNLC